MDANKRLPWVTEAGTYVAIAVNVNQLEKKEVVRCMGIGEISGKCETYTDKTA